MKIKVEIDVGEDEKQYVLLDLRDKLEYLSKLKTQLARVDIEDSEGRKVGTAEMEKTG